MIASWILFAVAAGLASNLYNFLNRYVLRKEPDSTAFGWLTEIVRLLIAMLILPFDFHFEFGIPAIKVFFLIGLVEVVSIYIFMKMHAFSHLSISTIISRTRLIWIPIIAYFILGESLKPIEYAGIGILFFGLSIAVSPRKIFMDKGIVYAYLSAFVVAILSIVMKSASPLMSTSMVLLGMSFLTVILFPQLMKNGQKRIKTMLRKNLFLKVFSSISNTGSMYLYIYALRLGEVSKVTAIYQGMMIVSILAGIIFLGETKDAWKKIIGAFITLTGVLILTTL